MAEENLGSPSRSATTGSMPSASMNGSLRNRLHNHRLSSPRPGSRPLPPELARRRSSILSYSSFEDATQSFANDILHPGGSALNGMREDAELAEQMTHWHSSPLVFAILPAIAGLLFKNGSAFVTDILLLGLAAVFMNWSIRLPWDWYYSAQAVRVDLEPTEMQPADGVVGGIVPKDAVEEDDEIAVETPASESAPRLSSPAPELQEQGKRPPIIRGKPSVQHIGAREEAAADLRSQEILAFISTFVLPALAAYLLHIIRAQLSQPSTTLVSDYNLSIFLLAAEIRPLRQLLRLISKRTMHLQRIVQEPTFQPYNTNASPKASAAALSAMEARLDALETNVPTTDPVAVAQKADLASLSATLRKSYEPRLESLERAVRRYEKRSTTLAMLTEQRLQSLETRIQEALSLAAVAAENSQKRSFGGGLLDGVLAVVTWPFKMALWLLSLPLILFGEIYEYIYGFLFGRVIGNSRGGKGGAKIRDRPIVKRSNSSK